MIVYADVLIILNFIINYFLLSATEILSKNQTKIWKIILSAIFGGITSLYIFLPQSVIIFELIYKIIICAAMVLIAFGYKHIKLYLKTVFVLFCVTCAYGGIMIAIWHIFKPNGMVINNSVVYFNISPLFLIVFTVIIYFALSLGNKIFAFSSVKAQKCEIVVCAIDKSIKLKAIVDNGNSITDVFGKSEIIIADELSVNQLFDRAHFADDKNQKLRYRIIPCKTVSGEGILEGYRCDKALIITEQKEITLKNPVLAISKVAINDGYNAIVNPKIFD